MESYEEFIHRQMSRIRSENDEESDPAFSQRASNIRFYGVPVLPPLLNKDQKEEMRRLREAAAHLIHQWKCSSLSRVSYIQNILDSVQLRKAPTFEDFKDETEATEAYECDETAESHWTSPIIPSTQQMPGEKAQIALSHPLTSTACDGHAALNFRPLEGEDSLENSHTTVLFEGVPLVGHKAERVLELTTDYSLDTRSLSQSHKHPQIDVSHQGLSSGYVTIEPSDVSSGWTVGGEGMEERRSDFGGLFLNSSNSTSIINHAPVDGEVLEEEYTISNQVQTEDVIDLVKPPVEAEAAEEGPYRMSLQSLLKKSQEHRRRQKMLRNQAKALKMGETSAADEYSLSDKENEEFFQGGTGKTEMRRIREKRRDQGKDQLPELKMPSLEIQTQSQGPDSESMEPSDLVRYVGDIDPTKCEMPLDFCLNITSASNTAGGITEKALPSYPSMADSPLQSTSATASPSAKSLYQSKSKKVGSLLPRPCQAASKQFNNVPTPKFCLSPVRSKKGSGISGSFRKPLVKTPVCEDDQAKPNPCSQAKWPLSLRADTEGDVPACRSTDQTEQIAQLELNLSSLKVLISDLESTLSKSQADFNPAETATDHNSSQQTPLAEHKSISLPASDGKAPSVVTFSEAVQQEVFAKDNVTRPGSKQQELPHRATSMVQKRRVPEVFRAIGNTKRLSHGTVVLADASNQPEERRNSSGEKNNDLESIEDSLNGSSLNRSYDVDTPSRLWSQAGPKGKQLTPELGGQEGVSRAKRRLLMNTLDGIALGLQGDEGRPQSSTPKVSPWLEQPLRQQHEVQVKALMEEQRRQQQELLQSLATRYQFLRSVSFPCPSVGSRLEDVATSLPPSSVSMGLGSSSQPSELTLAELSVLSDSLHISQSHSCLPVCHRPLVAAAVKGYLTRRLLRTERVAQLIRTIKDTQRFLQDFQCQTPGREFSSRQDRVLQERVTLQLRSARYELHDLFFSLCPADRMQVISWDRQLAREREFRHKENKEPQAGGKSTLSAATRKALERKRTVMLQKKAAERTKLALGTEGGWTLVPNPRRVPKKATPLRWPR
ncbi:uncharacterized protein cp110 isoform X2 [Salminus brasiliensis]|uniref:uncharacterized protein cp110 isoform X2 n=1 Tax=Salminus brasiliensis TaxID=930266 RepID=UPI003B833FAB